jgi:hypothetical protein
MSVRQINWSFRDRVRARVRVRVRVRFSSSQSLLPVLLGTFSFLTSFSSEMLEYTCATVDSFRQSGIGFIPTIRVRVRVRVRVRDREGVKRTTYACFS